MVTLDMAALKISIDKIEFKNSGKIKALILNRMKDNKDIKTMTFDNDMAFCLREQIDKNSVFKPFSQDPIFHKTRAVLKTKTG